MLDFLKGDFVKFFMDFHDRAILDKAFSSSFLKFVLKCNNPLGPYDYRPKCLFGCLYKAIAKLLAVKQKNVLSSIILNYQSAFVLGRQMLDGLLVSNEAEDYASKDKRGACCSRSTSKKLMTR